MSSRPNTRSLGVNDQNQTNDVEGLIARKINATLLGLISQVAAALNARWVDDGGSSSNVSHGCSYKIFMASNPKEFYGTEGAVGLLSWFENVESKLNITKCDEESKVGYASCMLQGRALTWWTTQVQTRRHEAANSLIWENFKRLMTKEYCKKDEVQKLEFEFWNHTMVGTEIDKLRPASMSWPEWFPTWSPLRRKG
ncbi:reverse transcriptase domain-containing protein [Tanacetum coccineum]